MSREEATASGPDLREWVNERVAGRYQRGSEWAGSSMPTNWREAFQLDGFSVPENCDESNEWEVCYFVRPAGHYFRAIFQGGKPFEIVVVG
jgi:hypothetical protein